MTGRQPSNLSALRTWVLRTEGQRLLWHQSGSVRTLARELGCGRQTVQDWRTGEKRPLPAQRERLRAAFGIPIAAWELPPTENLDATGRALPPTRAQPSVGSRKARAVITAAAAVLDAERALKAAQADFAAALAAAFETGTETTDRGMR